MDNELYRAIPQVEKILEDPNVARWFPVLSRPLTARVVSEALDGVRAGIRDAGTRPDAGAVLAAVDAGCARTAGRRLRRVVNATGVILHTNLGRAPLPRTVWESAAAVNTGYSTLEMDIETGRRGRRGGIVPDLLRVLTGCEDALVVNNNAAAVLLGLSALAAGREVIVSRGEQVQIGGGFRIPEILALSGARMVEVGTTNITTAEDYARALGPDTAMVLKVHSSNFRIRGFAETPGTAPSRASCRRGWCSPSTRAPGPPPRTSGARRRCARTSRRAPTSCSSRATRCWADRRRASPWERPTSFGGWVRTPWRARCDRARQCTRCWRSCWSND